MSAIATTSPRPPRAGSRWPWAALALLLALGFANCRPDPDERSLANAELRTQAIDEELTLWGDPLARVRRQGEALLLRPNGAELRFCLANEGRQARSVRLLFENVPASAELSCSAAQEAALLQARLSDELAEPALDDVLYRADVDSGEVPCQVPGTLSQDAASGLPALDLEVPAGSACASPGEGDVAATLRLPGARAAGELRFGVVGRLAGQRELLRRVRDRLAEHPLDFLILLGGLSDGADPRADLEGMAELCTELGLPVYATLGWDDVSDGGARVFNERFGPSDAAFDHHQVRFVLLDSADATLASDQLSWLGEVLSRGGVRRRLLFTYTPPFDPAGLRGQGFDSRREAARLVALLHEEGVGAVFAGSLGSYAELDLAGIPLYLSGATGEESFDAVGPHFLEVHLDSGEADGPISVERVDL